MKVWFDSITHFHCSRDGYRLDARSSSECDDDCGDSDCAANYVARSYHNTQASSLLDQESLYDIAAHRLQLSSTLYIQAYDSSHWLICNPVEAGNIAVIDEEMLSLLQSFRVPTTMRELIPTSSHSAASLLQVISTFIASGFLLDLDQEPIVQSESAESSTLSAWLHITNACNLRCSYCYIAKSADSMEQETSRRVVDAVIRSAVRHGYQGVHLKYAGGEAALKMPQVLAIHDYAWQQAREHGLQLSATLLSNGTIMTQRMVKQLKERSIHVTLSLDGIGAAHDRQRPYINGLEGSFSMVERTISRLLENEVRPSINVTVSQWNVTDLPALLSYILERDLHFKLSYYRENDCSSSLADLQFSEGQMIDGMRAAFTYIEQHLPRRRIVNSLIDKGTMRAPHHYTCGIGRNYLVINQRGEVAKCPSDITRVVTTIQAADPLQEIRDEQSGMQAIDVDEKEGCRTCTWRYWCGGGCPLVTYRMTGRNDIRSPNCAIYKALFPEAVRLEALRLLAYETPVSL